MSGSEKRDEDGSSVFKIIVAGGSAKALATTLAYPHEVVKTRLREENSSAKGFLHTLFELRRRDGIRVLYRGLSAQVGHHGECSLPSVNALIANGDFRCCGPS